MVAVTIGPKSLFLDEFFQKLHDLSYPKDKIFLHISVQNSTKFDYVRILTDSWRQEYFKVKLLPSENPAKCKQEAIHYAKNAKCEFIFFLSTVAQLEDKNVLKALIKENQNVVAPFLKTYEKFSYARRICQASPDQKLNDSHSFPSLVTQKGILEENYEKILVSFTI